MGEFKCGFTSFLVLLFFLCFNLFSLVHGQLLPVVSDIGENSSQIQIYIVHVLKPEDSNFLGAEDLENWHMSFLPNTTLDTGEPRLLYSYKEAISGFAARLTPAEVRAMENMDGFLGADLSERLELQTTYTHNLLDLSTLSGTWSTSNSFFGEGIIIGVLDTGIHLPHPSFEDTGMPPRPSGWKASCYLQSPSCNGKVIGAQSFKLGDITIPPTDIDQGHGTHVAGIAAGNFVDDAEVLDQALGKAAGMAPKAFISVYKVCWKEPTIGCEQSGILAGIDKAIQDGVHILQMSFGAINEKIPTSLTGDSVAVATFSAMQKGIFPCTAAGNKGPNPETLSHAAPWDMVVGATTTDRRIRATVTLGNGKQFHGETAYHPTTVTNKFLPLFFPGSFGLASLKVCNSTFNRIDITGKIVMCYVGIIDDIKKGDFVKNAGGAGMILMNGLGFTTFSKPHHLPVSHVSYKDANEILNYYASSSSPTAKITFGGTIFGARPAPALAQFSSRGPAKYNGNIVKPDVTAPGVNILSAWPVEVGPFPSGLKTKTFNFWSGTSMATPHVSGIVALIMSKLKNDNKRRWSTSEIQSALITTANTFDLDGKPIFDEATLNDNANILQRGAGQVNATNAMDPGLVYNIEPDQYVAYLCRIFSNNRRTVQKFTKSKSTRCTKSISSAQLNYPSIGVPMKSKSTTVTVSRTVTNVGDAMEVYNAKIIEPPNVNIDLSQYSLSFTRPEQQITYSITFAMKGAHPGSGVIEQGELSWMSNKHTVTSPIYIAF